MKSKKKKISTYYVGETVYIQGVWKAKILAISEYESGMIYVRILEGGLRKELDSGCGTFTEKMLTKKRIKA